MKTTSPQSKHLAMARPNIPFYGVLFASLPSSPSLGLIILCSCLFGPLVAPAGATLAPDVLAWGDNLFGQSSVPTGLSNVVMVAGGRGHSLALREDGSVVGWGDDFYQQSTIPEGLSEVVAIAAGGDHSLALKRDGTLVGWGNTNYGLAAIPAGLAEVVSVAAGANHRLALKDDGGVVAWGKDDFGQSSVPAGLSNVVAIAGGYAHSLALKADGTVVAWGNNYNGQTNVPDGLTSVTAIAAGHYHSLALKADGTLAIWGGENMSSVPTNVPAGLVEVVAISAGLSHNVALKRDGTVVVWGDNLLGQTNLPGFPFTATAVAAGKDHSLVITLPAREIPLQLFSPLRSGTRFEVSVPTLDGSRYFLESIPSLSETNWTVRAEACGYGYGVIRKLSDPAASTPQGFYRIRQTR